MAQEIPAYAGKYAAGGRLEKDARVSAISGQPIKRGEGEITIRITGTPYFYRIKPEEKPQLTPERKAALERFAQPSTATKAPPAPSQEKA